MAEISLMDIVALQRLCKNKKVFIFGTGRLAADYGNIIANTCSLLPCYLQIPGKEADKRILQKQIVSIEEIIKIKNDAYILLTELHGVGFQTKYLLDRGFQYLKDFNYISGAHFQTSLSKSTPLDPTLGHSTFSNDMRGCRFWGKKSASGIQIAVNGASLVDETCFDWKLWPRLVYERMEKAGGNPSFLLCASYGHTTSQSLLKLIRDILPLRPDIVIDYCSLENDCLYGEWMTAPFIVGYQKKILSLVKNQIKDRFENRNVNQINLGNRSKRRTAEVILDNIYMSKLLCEAYGIRYICVFPPSITTQKVHAPEDMELQWSFAKYGRIIQRVYTEIEEKMEEAVRDCVVDGRSWLDGYDNLFYDQFHLYENGNQLIADKMMEVLGYGTGTAES
ncbi:MAG: hypothetical protein HDR11_04505 [Lachnospiraceae bacterium]|nr:hypothetical protein [Lachnospiraceae bacterium]